jgi:ABC-2 type transport system ATP-binding protein
MSHGQQVKAGLLLILARRPRLLVLDEPTTGLDPVARQEVLAEMMEVLRDEDRTVIFSSHNTQDIERLSDQITFVDRGRIIDSRDKEEFLDRWRRLRLDVPPEVDFPSLPGVLELEGSGRLRAAITCDFNPELVASIQGAGAAVQKVEVLTLEEIFVAEVRHSRKEGNR